jgi:DNA-binding NarL/FixJ family response regulator
MRILIVDDSDIIRRVVTRILAAENRWAVCGEAKNGAEALQKAVELQPDLILLDIGMPDINGLEVARRLKVHAPRVKILVISQNDSDAMLPCVVQAGANGCVDKNRLGMDLLPAIARLE